MTWPRTLPPWAHHAACTRCGKPWLVVTECLGWELTACWVFGAHLHASCPTCSQDALYADPDPSRKALAQERHRRLVIRRAKQKKIFLREFLVDAEKIIERLGPLPKGGGSGVLGAWVVKHRAAVRDLGELLVTALRVDKEMEEPSGKSSLCRFDEIPTLGKRTR